MPEEGALTLQVPRRLADRRLDSVLFLMLRETVPGSDISRSLLTEEVRLGRVLLNGQPAKPGTLLAFKDEIRLEGTLFAAKKKRLEGLESGKIPLIIEQTPDYLVLNKPAGLSMHPVAGKKSPVSLTEWLVTAFPEIAGVGEDPLRPGIVHRLDRDTSGAVVVARTTPVFHELKKAFHDRLAKKSYIALVYGHLREQEGNIEMPLERTPGSIKRRVPRRKASPSARMALTRYRVLGRLDEYDILDVSPETGRTHQIRVHLAYLGHPIAGDRLYGFKKHRDAAVLFPRHMLHAWRLSFPFQGTERSFEAPLPQDFLTSLRGIDGRLEPGYDGEALKSLFSEYEGPGFFVSLPTS